MKQIATVALIFFISYPLLAQESETWPAPGAVWKYCVTGDSPPFSVWSHTFTVTSDTVIGSHTYAMVRLTEVNDEPLATDGSSWWIPEENMRTYFRQSEDTVYRHVNGEDHVFMIHGIEPNQEFTTFRSLYDDFDQWSCTDELPLAVLSADVVEYDGATYRELVLQDLDPFFEGENALENTYVFIEGVGLKHEFPFLTPEHAGDSGNDSGDLAECLGGVLHLPASSLYHYHDDTRSIDFFECDITVSTDDVNSDRASFRLFPNPAKDVVTIEAKGDGQQRLQVRVYDMRGMLLNEYVNVMPRTSIDLGWLSSGIYLVSVESDNDVVTQKLVIE